MTSTLTARPDCPLCDPATEVVLWQDALCRVILADEPLYPGFCRVIWHDHVAEFTDLDAAGREHVMRIVYGVESVLRELMCPDKINLASLGNQVPHLHWHVIPRFRDDAHFPDAVWAKQRRSGAEREVDVVRLARLLEAQLGG
jgi:diadenosine tetraphosphate (Ap4A) HIT family hydrolase